MTRADLQPLVDGFWASIADFDPDAEGGLDAGPLRAGYDRFGASMDRPAQLAVERVDAAGVGADWVTVPDSRDACVYVHLHGGGYVLGSSVSHRSFAGWVAARAGARVLLPDYRLAPEHPFPAALEDTIATYRWLLDAGQPPSTIVLGGESAGAGAVLAAAMAIRDAGLPAPAGLALLSPWADVGYEEGSRIGNRDTDPICSIEAFAALAALVIGDGDPRDPRISPVHGRFGGLPPLSVHIGSGEVLLDDALRIVERARAAGDQAELVIWRDMIHTFQIFAALFEPAHEAWQAIDRVAAFVADVTDGG